MNWEALGAVGEIVGAVAVVLTLGYLAVQIRQNTQATKTSSLQAALSAAMNVFDAPARDRDLARVIRSGMADPSSLTDDEYAQFRWWARLALRAAENVFVQHNAGVLDHETWVARAETLTPLLAAPGGRKVWAEISASHRRDFQDWVASLLNEQGSSGGVTPAA